MKYHADLGTQQSHIFFTGEQVFAVEQYLALGPLLGVELKHAVKNPQQGRLSATRGANESSHFTCGDVQIDVFKRMELTVVKIQVFYGNFG